MSADIYLRKRWLAECQEPADAGPEASGLAVDGRVEDGIGQFRLDHVLGEFARDTGHGDAFSKWQEEYSKSARFTYRSMRHPNRLRRLICRPPARLRGS